VKNGGSVEWAEPNSSRQIDKILSSPTQHTVSYVWITPVRGAPSRKSSFQRLVFYHHQQSADMADCVVVWVSVSDATQ
jgi:hypothetical protein